MLSHRSPLVRLTNMNSNYIGTGPLLNQEDYTTTVKVGGNSMKHHTPYNAHRWQEIELTTITFYTVQSATYLTLNLLILPANTIIKISAKVQANSRNFDYRYLLNIQFGNIRNHVQYSQRILYIYSRRNRQSKVHSRPHQVQSVQYPQCNFSFFALMAKQKVQLIPIVTVAFTKQFVPKLDLYIESYSHYPCNP